MFLYEGAYPTWHVRGGKSKSLESWREKSFLTQCAKKARGREKPGEKIDTQTGKRGEGRHSSGTQSRSWRSQMVYQRGVRNFYPDGNKISPVSAIHDEEQALTFSRHSKKKIMTCFPVWSAECDPGNLKRRKKWGRERIKFPLLSLDPSPGLLKTFSKAFQSFLTPQRKRLLFQRPEAKRPKRQKRRH